MEQQIFDASNILSRLRRNKELSSPHSSNVRPGRQSGYMNQSPSQPFRSQFQRKERPEVRIELENEIDYLASEVARLRRENIQLLNEKEELEFKCADIKEKSDATISHLRNKLVALNKKFNEAGSISNKDKFVARKNLHKTFSNGAGVLSINKSPPSVPATNPNSSIHNLTFSQYMKRSTRESNDEFNSSLRQNSHQQHHHQHQESSRQSHPHSHFSSTKEDRVSSRFEPTFEEEADQRINSSTTTATFHGKNQPSSQHSPSRPISVAPPPRSDGFPVENNEMEQLEDIDDPFGDNHLPPDSSSSINPEVIEFDNHNDHDSVLPVVDIDLRSI